MKPKQSVVNVVKSKMVSRLLEYLNGRKIARIVQESTEKNDEIALKLMCVIDQKLEEGKLYDEMDASPKLMKKLLNFRSFSQFHFYKYRPLKNFNHILKCKYCTLHGPYYLMLSHMALSHGSNVGAKMCLWCHKIDMLDHVKKRNLITCYENYLKKEDLEEDVAYPSVVIKFYELIENLAKLLGVLTERKQHYLGRGSVAKEKHYFDDDDIDSEMIVHRHRPPQSTINIQVLNQLYEKIMGASNGVNNLQPILKLHRINTPIPSNDQVQRNSIKRKQPGSSNAKEYGNIRLSANKDRYDGQRGFNEFTRQLNSTNNINNQTMQISPFSLPSSSIVGFGAAIESMIDTLPNEHMKRSVKLKIQTLVLEYSTRAIQENDNA